MSREEDLKRIAKKLDKMVFRNNTEGALDLLKELQNFNMTLKLLQDTRIGMSVNGIRKHCTDEDVVSLAKILIKNWKRLLESGQSQKAERPNEMKNGNDSSKQTLSPSEHSPESSPKSVLSLNKKPAYKHRTEKGDAALKNERPDIDHKMDKHLSNHTKDRERMNVLDSLSTVHPSSLVNRPTISSPSADIKKERREAPDVFSSSSPHGDAYPKRPIIEAKKERREPPDPYPFHLHRPLPAHIRIPKHQPEVKKERREGTETLSPSPSQHSQTHHSSPLPKRPSLEAPKERKKTPDPNAPLPPLPLHLHPPPQKPSALEMKKQRKESLDPDAPIPPLPLHLHPPTPPKRSSLDMEKEKDRKDTPTSKRTAQQQLAEHKKDRKESVDPDAPLPPLPLHLHPPTPTKRPSLDMEKEKDRKDTPATKRTAQQQFEQKKDRKDSTDGKQQPPKKSSHDVKKERRDSINSKSGLSSPAKKLMGERKDSIDSKSDNRQPSSDPKSQRKDSVNSKSGSSLPAGKLTGERKESHGPKLSLPGALQRKMSTDSNDGRKSKPGTPKTPTTPTTPVSPSFSSAVGPLSPRLLTGDSIRDKCIEMLSAALRTDDDYKDYGVNCDTMAAEIEDHIYQEIKATDMKYKNRVRSRISNLKDPKNPNLRKNVLGGAIELSRIATMTAEEMASDELKQLRSVLTQEAIREHQMAKTGGTVTDLLQCPKCKKKNCTYNQVQTRSADEPMTTFVLCNECGNRWKFC